MAALYPDTRSMLQILASAVLEVGELPKHIAIIMDGNRRYAKAQGLLTKYGHVAGRWKVKELLRWCHELRIPELTLYSFSIENFKRTKEQVDELMTLMYDYGVDMMNGVESIKESGWRVEFIGNWNLVPSKLKPNMARMMEETRAGTGMKINIAMAYTGRAGILQSLSSVERGIQGGSLQPGDVSEYLIDQAQNLSHMAPVDILIRTGGDWRISDFMIWESAQAYVHFLDVAWPDVTYWQVLDCLFKWQMFRRDAAPRVSPPQQSNARMEGFLNTSRQGRWDNFKKFSKKATIPNPGPLFEETGFRQGLKDLLAGI